MAEKNKEQLPNGFDAKAMLTEHGKKGTVIKYNDRVKLVVTQATMHYHEGQIITPHKVMGEALVKQGIAKEYKEDKK